VTKSAQTGEKEEPVNSSLGSLQRSVPTTGIGGGRATTDNSGLPRQAVSRSGVECDHRIYDGAVAEELWDALTRARQHYAPLVLTAAEDALLKFYLPLAREMADSKSVAGADPVVAKRTAEVALAQAIVGWDQRTSEGFDGYACAAIAFRLMDLPGACTEAVQTAGSATAASVAAGGIPAALR